MNLANKFTVSRLLLVPLFFLFAAPMPENLTRQSAFLHFVSTNSIYISTFIFVIAAITDKIDGFIARKYNQITRFGIFLDPVADKLMVASALILLVLQNKVSILAAVIIIGREFAVNGLRIIAAQHKLVLAADKLGKIKMVAQVVAITAALLDNYPFSLFCTIQLDDFFMLIAVLLTAVSGLNYFLKNKAVFLEDTNIKPAFHGRTGL